MIKFINDALKHRNGEKGFSLVELIVVVAILGILVVIAIPVFGAIQATARENTVKTAAANAATTIAASIAAADPNNTVAQAIAKLDGQGGEVKYTLAAGASITPAKPTNGAGTPASQTNPTVTPANTYNTTVDNVYVYAVGKGGEWAAAGSAGAAKSGTFN